MLVLIYYTQCVKLTIFFIIKYESSSQSICYLNYILNLRWFIVVLLESLVNNCVIYFLSPPPKKKPQQITTHFFLISPPKKPGDKPFPKHQNYTFYSSSSSLDEKYRFSKTETLLKLYGNLELKFPV